VDSAALRDLCLSFPGSQETFPFRPGAPVYKVAGKVFALSLERTPLSVNLKSDPALAAQLREAYPEIGPGWHMNKRHWITVVLAGALAEQLVHDLVEDSYDLVVAGLPRTRQAALLWSGRRADRPR
jgi:predicted DNA-binding protein (MmcQ/YjbR family)